MSKRETELRVEEEAMAARYWCHMCRQAVDPIINAEIKCPYCGTGFVEETSEEINGGGSSKAA
ncbi:hypothetical protein Bca52824_034342 [Brassica carinata]|uniref:RING-type E3 ubiquitin transferase n=1 Tax=Brassica carinata TaxID=52824 RepID=A0A8X7UZD0_BRACI|nr:hypothetical protein Bca52824_034342 [Brassica carinata]